MMQIQLPSAADVANAIEIWSAGDARLGVLLNRYGKPAPALRHYGLVLWESGDLQSASRALTGAAALAPDDALVWNDLASVFSALGHPNEAGACATESLARDSTQGQIWVQLGAIRRALGDSPASAEAYRNALSIDAGLIDAWVGLGLANLSQKRFGEAAELFREAIKRGKAEDAAVQGCLGQALEAAGDFEGAASAFALACGLQPDNHAFRLKWARTQFAVDAISGSAEEAVVACTRLGLSEAEIEKITRDTFQRLSAYEHRRAAISIGEWRLAHAPVDEIQAYLLAALKGEATARAPDGYIISFFDKFADQFDQQVVDVLGYRVPGQLADMAEDLARTVGRPLSRILDLGCGTGLAGARLARPERILRGVDLSPRMLDKARNLGCYTTLSEAEVVGYLANTSDRYDLVVAADLLIYFGDLAAIFEGTAKVLDQGGFFAFSVETTCGDKDVAHLSSGRFAHRPTYVERLAIEAGFTIRERRETTIRLDAKTPAIGALFLLSRN